MSIQSVIDSFSGKYSFLSNFYLVEVLGYPSTEHFFQAMKTIDKSQRVQFRNTNMTPGQSKRAGRRLTLRDDWEDIKSDVMETGLRAKFAPDSDLAQMLLDTEDSILVEGNGWHDNIWGDCGCNGCKEIPGQNILGTLLMQIRDELNNRPEEDTMKDMKDINLNLVDSKWHIITQLDGAMLCRMNQEDWDNPPLSDHWTVVNKLDANDDTLCSLCLANAKPEDIIITTPEEAPMTINPSLALTTTHKNGETPLHKNFLEFIVQFRLTGETLGDWMDEEVFTNKAQALYHMESLGVIPDGEFRLIAKTDLDALVNYPIINKEEAVLYEYRTETYNADKTVRQFCIVITNKPIPSDKEALEIYRVASEDGRPSVAQIRQNDAGLPKAQPHYMSSSWVYPMLNRLIAIGYSVKVEQYKDRTNSDFLKDRLAKSSFSYSDAGGTTIIFVKDDMGEMVSWDDFPAVMGLIFKNSKKFAKRAKELTRKTLYWDISTHDPLIHTVEFDPELEIAVDGAGVMSGGYFIQQINNIPDPAVRNRMMDRYRKGETVRVNSRLVFSGGLIKGDKIIVPNNVLRKMYPDFYEKHGKVPDFVEPTINGEMVNCKDEIRTDGTWSISTSNPHHGHSQPMTNDQLLACISQQGTWFFTAEMMKADMSAYVNEVVQEFKDGKYPKYMMADPSTKAIERDGVKQDPDRLAARLQQMSYRYTYAGRPLTDSNHLLGMVGKGFGMMLKSNCNPKEASKNEKIVTPVGHAAFVHVMTLSLIHMCGYNPEEEGFDTTKHFYYTKAHSWVAPDSEFIKNFERHGTYDLDDSLIVAIRNTYDVNLGETAENTVVRAFQYRFPMAWGEYSIVEVDIKDFPFYHTWNDMPTVNITKGVRTEFLEEMDQTFDTLPYSDYDMPDDYTIEHSQYQLELAILNPGVGRVVNPMIGKYATDNTYFKEQLDSTSELVDCMEQTPNEGAFLAIGIAIDNMVEEVLSSENPMDAFIWKTRFGGGKGAKKPEGLKTFNGFFTEMIKFNQAITVDYFQRMKRLANAGRTVIPTLMEITLPETIEAVMRDGGTEEVNTVGYAKRFLAKYRKDMDSYPGDYDTELSRRFIGELNRKIVDNLLSQPNRDWILVAIYQQIINANGSDNFFFQNPLMADETAVMDLWLDTLFKLGLATKRTDDGRVVRKEVIKE